MEDAGIRSAAGAETIQLKKISISAWFRKEHGLAVLITFAMLGLWEILIHLGMLSPLFFPAPGVIVRTLYRWISSGSLIPHFTASLSRMMAGFAIGAGAGLLAGLLMGWSEKLRSLADPFVAALHPVPKIAVFPLMMIVLGIGEASKIAVVAVSAFFPMAISTIAGVRQIRPLYFDVAQNFGAKPLDVFTRVIIPGSLPMILSGTRLGLNSSLTITIAAELVTAQAGLGTLIRMAWETLRTEELYAGLAVISALGIAFNLLLHLLTKVLIPWQENREEKG
ncbi:MAG: ABC transporter permease [Desulfococcaceae bacterium]|jgi:NitT/TauT family transport system permease protein|nr:ABC transporter permease [Desulfococcaceae bacterium]